MKFRTIIFDLDDTLIDTFGKLKVETVWEDIKTLELKPGVREFLMNFPAQMLLVTKEKIKDLQMKKIEVLGIKTLFERMIICASNEEKRECFLRLKKELEGEIWVVGDRIDAEIRFGNEVGWKTVWLRQGKYKDLKAQNNLEIPDDVIEDFKELESVICKQ